MIFYFSGTGNSQFVAKQIATAIDDKLVFINKHMKTNTSLTFQSEKPLLFVVPTYAWRLPKVVEKWILENTFQGNQDAYFILTCGDNCGNASTYAKKLCQKKAWNFYGLAPIVMPENYLAMFPTPSKVECEMIIERAIPSITSLIDFIKNKTPFPNPLITVKDRLESGPVNPLFYTFAVHDKGFSVSSTCISCKKCEKLCPLKNISLELGTPKWHGNCTHCMACIAGCPKNAIEYKKVSQGQHRHFILDEVVTEY